MWILFSPSSQNLRMPIARCQCGSSTLPIVSRNSRTAAQFSATLSASLGGYSPAAANGFAIAAPLLRVGAGVTLFSCIYDCSTDRILSTEYRLPCFTSLTSTGISYFLLCSPTGRRTLALSQSTALSTIIERCVVTSRLSAASSFHVASSMSSSKW